MSLQILDDLEQRSPEWYDQRRGIVTASAVGRLVTAHPLAAIEYPCPECDAAAGGLCVSKVKRNGTTAAAIKTLHPARTAAAKRKDAPTVIEPADGDDARALTALLAAERITGWTEETVITSAMWRGIDDEPRARDAYSEHFAPVVEAGFMVRDDWGFRIGYSPDGLVGDDGLIEVKSRQPKKQLQTVLADEVPAENMAQLQCGLLVSGRDWIDYVSYCGGMALYVKRVTPDPAWFDAIVAAVERFEETVARMTADYHAAVKGLPMTERVIELEMFL